MKIKSCIIIIFLFIIIPLRNPTSAQIDRFLPRQGGETEVWRITHDPTMRDWANYHNVNCWSPDGRYICFTHYAAYESQSNSEVHLYDIYEDKDIKVDRGTIPRWANNNNWLFYVRRHPEDGDPNVKGTQVMWFDVDANKKTRIAYGVPGFGSVDFGDRWLFGYKNLADGKRTGVRIPIRENSRAEIINIEGYQWQANPRHPVVFTRVANNWTAFDATRYWCDLDGKNITIGCPTIQQCHQSWSGDGTYYMLGNSQMRGRRWDEPFPSNLHYIAAVNCGDISSCGKSGRWICGSGNYGPLQIADLWSGDGQDYLKAALCRIHDSDKFSYCSGSALHDNDSKGSPDGTKISFVSNYDLKDGPVTEITEYISGTSGKGIPVKSTEGFPESGRLSVRNEIIGYARKTSTSFEGLKRGLYGTTPSVLEGLTPELRKKYAERPADLSKGLIISSFDARMLTVEQRNKLPMPSRFKQEDFSGDKNSPLLWQRRTDVYIAVVRLPDRPYLRKIGEEIELIPGENHWETYGYNIFKDGEKITRTPLRPGTTFTIPQAGIYSALAVEWSGLESRQSISIQILNSTILKIRLDKPADFSWTYERWLVDGKEVDVKKAGTSSEAVKEIVHPDEGVIHSEWYNWGQITKRHDLNHEGKSIRRLFYLNGRLARREFHNRDGIHTSTEIFDPKGYITESILYRTVDGKRSEYDHWWYERGMPMKYIGKRRHHTGSPKGAGTYVKEGEQWVKKD